MAADPFILPQGCCDSPKYLCRFFTKFDSSGKPLRTAPNNELFAGTIIQGTPYMATYNNSDGAFYLHGFFGNPYNVPLAAGMDFWGSTAPNASFAFPTGQAISRTTYAALFALIGTTYGTGDGTTTFNLPDKTGRVSAMKEAAASRLTATYFGATSGQNGAMLGAVGGSESHLLTSGEMPAHTHANSLSDPGHTHQGSSPSGQPVTPGNGAAGQGLNGLTATSSSGTGITLSNASAGGGSAHSIVQPTIVCNYIMRVL